MKILKITGIVLLTGFIAACGVNESKGKRVLESQGLKDVQILGYSWFGCSQDDAFKSNFRAMSADGRVITGTLCQGILKGITVRYD